ncbi:MAG: DEAD/DEAH box helicase family protein, partial [Myxococcaceae bacterium]
MSFPFRIVTRSAEFDRVMNLPKRELSADASGVLTQKLRTENGTMTLRPIQAQALSELEQCQGLFAPIRVGGGKTLISLLAPVLLQAKRPLLLMPAKLIAKTEAEAKVLGQHWRLGKLKIMSYELLGHERGQKEFLEYAPDFIIADECHKLKNTKAAVTRRVSRYISKNPKTVMLAMSGTITKRSIRDFWHIAKWCLRSNAPVPLNWPEMSLWADALDENVPALMRVKP